MPWEERSSNVLGRHILKKLSDGGIDADPILSGLKLTRAEFNSPKTRIPTKKIDLLFEAAADALKDNSFGVRFGLEFDPREIGLLAYLGFCSHTLIDAINNFAQYLRVFSDDVAIAVEKQKDSLLVELKLDDPEAYFMRQSNEASLSLLLSVYRQFATRSVIPIEVHFRHSRLAKEDEFKRIFKCPIYFTSEHLGFVFDFDDVDIPLATADDRLFVILRNYCDEILASHANEQRPFVSLIESHIVDALPTGKAVLSSIAAKVGMSERTLSRRLADEGTSFLYLRNRLRMQIAAEYLESNDLSLAQIAFLLGFSETSAFNHAYKRWYGKTPGAARSLVSASAQ